MLLSFFKLNLISTFLALIITTANAQDFFKAYEKDLSRSIDGNSKKLNERTIAMMKEAFDRYKVQTGRNILAHDTLYIVNSSIPINNDQLNVIWNSESSMCYRYRVEGFAGAKFYPLKVWDDASARINNYRRDFRNWVESSDVEAYAAFGNKSSAPDGEFTSFIVATKTDGRWRFVRSGSFSNNVRQTAH